MSEDRPSAGGAGQTELARRLGLWSAVAVVIGSTIGSGIFRSPAGIADKLPGPLPMLARLDRGRHLRPLRGADDRGGRERAAEDGGDVRLLQGRVGRLAGFLFGWGQFSMIRAASLGAISITFAEYFFRVLGFNPQSPDHPTVHRGRRRHRLDRRVQHRRRSLSANVSNFTVLAKYGGLVFIVVVAFALGLPHIGAHFSPAVPAGQLHSPRVRSRARFYALGIRRLGRSRVQRGRGEGSGPQSAARADRRDARRGGDLPRGESRVHRRARRSTRFVSRSSSPLTSRSACSAGRASRSSRSR